MRALKRVLVAAAALAISVPGDVAAQRSGAEVWSQTCGNCHQNQPPNRYSATNWASIVTHMKITANLTDDESDAVLEFLQAGARRSASAEDLPEEGVQLASEDPAFLPLSDGAKIYKAQCLVCHGESGEGNGPAAGALDPPPSDLTDGEKMGQLSDKALLEILAEGRGTMPGFASLLTPEELEAVRKYIRTLVAKEDS